MTMWIEESASDSFYGLPNTVQHDDTASWIDEPASNSLSGPSDTAQYHDMPGGTDEATFDSPGYCSAPWHGWRG